MRRFSQQFAKGFTVTIEEWDICRGADQDLLSSEVQESLFRRIEAGEFCCVIMSPPCASWSRAPWANPWGPRPLRTAVHPWGMPWLEGARLQKVADSNSMIRFCLRIFEVAERLQPLVALLLEHPEDLGATRAKPSLHIRPASIWQLPELRKMVEKHFYTIVFYQCVLGAPSRKPTRFLTSLLELLPLGIRGWPRLSSEGLYLGPLPAACRCGRQHRGIIKKSADEDFTTTQAAAYPPFMNSLIAKAIFAHCNILFSSSRLKRGLGSEEDKRGVENEEKEKGGVENEEAFFSETPTRHLSTSTV